MNKQFADVVDTVDHLEVRRITIQPNGKFVVPNEKDGQGVAAEARSARAARSRRSSVSSPTAPAVSRS